MYTHPAMKPFFLRSALFMGAALTVAVLPAQTGNIGVNNDGAAPNATAILDVSSNYLAPATQKGLLIPRMSQTQRNAIPAPANGLTIYQTSAPTGIYYYDGVTATWVRLSTGGSAWGLVGNGGTNPATDFLGTTDNQALVFRTNNAEGMRVDTDGDLGVGTATPLERLDIVGAIKLTGTSATNTLGTIRWNAGSQYHEGNIDGTVNGWRKLENDYTEVFNQSYSQPGTPTCANGSVTLGEQNAVGNNGFISPYWHSIAGLSRVRHQYLFRADELNVQLNQLFNDPNATEGLCAGQPINSIGFYVTGNAGIVKQYTQLSVTIKHTTQNALTTFDNTADPASQCYTGTSVNIPNTGGALFGPAAAGWDVYPLPGPFIWNGVDNIIIEYCYATGNLPSLTNVEIWQTNFLGFNATYTRGGTGTACNPVGGCGGLIAGCGMTPTCGTGGAYQNRPVIQFNGVVATAPPATAGSGNYIQYDGGLMVETTPGSGWPGNQTPGNYTFKGPGTIHAQNGVYDDQVMLNDHVFDRYFDGRVHPADAPTFGHLRHMGIDEMYNYVEMNRHLPTMKGRTEWDVHGGFGLGDLTNQLWRTAETHALYLTELKDRADLLTLLSTDQAISGDDFVQLRAHIATLEGFNESEKQALIEGLRSRVNATNDKR